MTKQILITLILFTGILNSRAQNAIGIRGGFSNGFIFKHFLDEKNAFEFLLANRWGGMNTTGLYEIHNDLKRANFRWYYGAGAHIGRWRGERNPWFNDYNTHLVVGIDGIVGIEYNFKEIPFNVSLDYKPGINIVGYLGYWPDEVAFSVRYVFGRKFTSHQGAPKGHSI